MSFLFSFFMIPSGYPLDTRHVWPGKGEILFLIFFYNFFSLLWHLTRGVTHLLQGSHSSMKLWYVRSMVIFSILWYQKTKEEKIKFPKNTKHSKIHNFKKKIPNSFQILVGKTTKIVPKTSLERVFFSTFDTRRVPEVLFLRLICSSTLRVASPLELVVLFGTFVVVVVSMFAAFSFKPLRV